MSSSHHDFLVGTFNTPSLFTLRFTTNTTKSPLRILAHHDAIGSHSWLHLNPATASNPNPSLYATAWTEPPALAAYTIRDPTSIQLINTASTKTRSGYVCASATYAYSAGGASGEVYSLDPTTGAFTSPRKPATTNGEHTINGTGNGDSHHKSVQATQTLSFVHSTAQRDNGSTMDFGGLRHGAHSTDLSPDGKLLYVADIGRNCIWVYSIHDLEDSPSHLKLEEKKISPRSHDGPRHVHPHPNGRVVYVLQEHSSVVDVFDVISSNEGTRLVHRQGVRIIPQNLPADEFWADEVRTSLSEGAAPKYMYASTRGLKEGRKGYVAVYKINEAGHIEGADMLDEEDDQRNTTEEPRDDDQTGLLCMYETATSGGWANAIQPGPTVDGVEYIAMTDSEVGLVFVFGWDGRELKEVGRVDLNDFEGASSGGEKHGAATAVWL